MKPLLSILLLFPLVTTSHAKVVGPLCQWVNDPSKSLSIHWIETSQPSVKSKGNFTLKYRRAENDPWQDTSKECGYESESTQRLTLQV